MTDTESKIEVKYLKGLFPNLTPDQGLLLVKEFLPYDVKIVREVIERHRLTYPEFVNMPNIAEGLRAAVARRHALRSHDRAAERETAHAWQNADKLVDEMSDDELEEMKTHVLTTCPHLNEHGRAMLGPISPRKSKTIRGLIAQALKSPVAKAVFPSSAPTLAAAGMVASDFDA